MKRLLSQLPALVAFVFAANLFGQGLSDLPKDPRMSSAAAEREQAIAPGLEAMQRHDYARAQSLFEAVLPDHPHDGRVLMFAGQAAHLAGDDKKALEYYKALLSVENPQRPQWRMHMQIVPLYAANGDWQGFDKERMRIREAAAQSDPFFATVNAYHIDDFQVGEKHVEVTEYLQLFGRFHTRYRFAFPLNETTHWRPFVDCESDDIDQVSFAKAHPELAAQGGRTFSLDGYMQANMHSTIMLFGDGEPSYETVRELVLKRAEPMSTMVRN